MTYIDAILIVLVISGVWAGFRQGLITAFVSLLGAVFGALAALTLAPMFLSDLPEGGRTAGGLGTLLVGILLGELLGGWAGKVLSEQVTWSPAKAVDRTLGGIGQGLAVLMLAWLVALPLAATPLPSLTSAIRNSAILAQINKVIPDGATVVSAQLRNLLDSTGFPAILDPLAPTPITEVPAPDQQLITDPVAQNAQVSVLKMPDQQLITDPVAQNAQVSVLKIRSDATSCGKVLTGTGFVIGPEHILTNAHVVGGSSRSLVETGGSTMEATVVLYDSDRDLAVLYVPGLDLPTLNLRQTPAESEDDAIVLGYPGGGPYTVTPARIRSDYDLSGPNIYGTDTVNRDVYILRAAVRPGNSGGPLLDRQGQVIGVVFGSAIDDPDTGFALTVAEVQSTVTAGLTDTSEAETGACAMH